MARPELPKLPPIGVRLSTDFEARGSGFRARVRWTDPTTKERQSRTRYVTSTADADAFFDEMRKASRTGIDPTITLNDFVAAIGDRWLRGIDMTSTGEGYRTGLRLRVLPTLGHLRISDITTGMIDRLIDDWEPRYSSTVIKNSIAPLGRVLDEAVRDDIIAANPARNRARRSLHALDRMRTPDESPRAYAIPDLATLQRLANACLRVHVSYHDHVMASALLAARGSEVSGLRVGDFDLEHKLATIARQTYPGAGGLVTKPTKGRKVRVVPILEPLMPIIERLTEGRQPDEPLIRGPLGGVLTTASVRRATKWDSMVVDLGLPNLTRHGLRHTGATWMADSGIPLHVLQEILGHESLETTRGYLHPDRRHLTDAGAMASRFLKQAAPKPGRSAPAI